MKYPEFYDKVESLTLQDPLSNFLGALKDGILKIDYLDCVKVAGHSCPTVAGAYLMTKLGLERLYTDTLPQRGMVHVTVRENENEGVAGVIGNIVSYIVGAAGKGGFKGINGNFSRNDLIDYGVPMDCNITLTRIDTNASVALSYSPSLVPADPKMQELMGKILQYVASDDERKEFGKLWQKRVETILLSSNLWDKLVTIC